MSISHLFWMALADKRWVPWTSTRGSPNSFMRISLTPKKNCLIITIQEKKIIFKNILKLLKSIEAALILKVSGSAMIADLLKSC